MESVGNKYITVAYRLYTMEDGTKELFEEAKAEYPFQFISGLGTTLEDFEEQIVPLKPGDRFSFTIPCEKAYGEYDDNHVVELPRTIFEVDGQFDSENVKEGSVVPLMTAEGQQVSACVVEIKPDVVIVDLNHPLAGDDLLFEGEVVENRLATNEEVQEQIALMTGGGGCGCGGGGCGSGCGSGCDRGGCNSGSCGCH